MEFGKTKLDSNKREYTLELITHTYEELTEEQKETIKMGFCEVKDFDRVVRIYK
jgi:hypothetical protein